MSGIEICMFSEAAQSTAEEAMLCLGEPLGEGYESSSSKLKNGSGLCEREP